MTTPTAPHFIRPCTIVWLALVALTMVTFAVGEAGLGGAAITLLVLGIAAFKVQMVAAYFMGLRRTTWLWRGIMLGWLLLVVMLITIAYLKSPQPGNAGSPAQSTERSTKP